MLNYRLMRGKFIYLSFFKHRFDRFNCTAKKIYKGLKIFRKIFVYPLCSGIPKKKNLIYLYQILEQLALGLRKIRRSRRFTQNERQLRYRDTKR